MAKPNQYTEGVTCEVKLVLRRNWEWEVYPRNAHITYGACGSGKSLEECCRAVKAWMKQNGLKIKGK